MWQEEPWKPQEDKKTRPEKRQSLPLTTRVVFPLPKRKVPEFTVALRVKSVNVRRKGVVAQFE
jgi:hypothetical protein